MKQEMLKELLSELLNCGVLDVDVIISIDRDILLEAIKRLRDGGIELNFQTLFTEAVRVAEEKYNLKVSEIDSNYLAARVYAADKRSGKKLDELGFPTVY